MSVKGTIDSLIRDKASIIFIALYLLYSILYEVNDIYSLIRLILMVVLVLGILYENHRHTERTGKYSKGLDLMRELKDWMTVELNSYGQENETTDSEAESGITEDSVGANPGDSTIPSSTDTTYCKHGYPRDTRCKECNPEQDRSIDRDSSSFAP